MLDLIWQSYPCTFRNNRGRFMMMDAQGKRYQVRFGIPEPSGRTESDNAPKGGDRVGWHSIEVTPDMAGKRIAVFTNIEAKTLDDKLKSGQVKFHNQVLDAGGISEIWIEQEDGSVKKIKERIDE